MGKHYILDGEKAVEVDLSEWTKWFAKAKRVVAKDKIKQITISTVFLGLNHNYGEGKPLIFETMVFGGSLDQEQERYSTWDEAIRGHDIMKKRVLTSLKEKKGE